MKNNSGFSMMELMISVGLLGAVTLGVTQLTKTSDRQSQKFSEKIELNKLTNLISQEYSKIDVCSAQFKNRPLENDYTELRSGGRVLLKVGETVLGGKFQVEKIQTVKLDKARFNLKMSYKKLRVSNGGRAEFVENLPITAEINIPENKIISCYESVAEFDYTGACSGPGVLINADESCSIKDFTDRNLNCPAGSFFSSLTFNATTLKYEITCKEPLAKTAACSKDQIQQYTAEGGIECVELNPKHLNPVQTTIAANMNCGVISESNKLRFSCDASIPADPVCPPQPVCTPPQVAWNCLMELDDCPVWTCSKLNPCGGGTEGGTTTTSGGSGGGCFIAGTPIKMSNGDVKNIEDILVGDKLLDGNNKVVTVQKLLPRPFEGEIYSINGGEYFFTPNHPFKSIAGWKSVDPELTHKESPELKTTKLQLGDVLVKYDGLELVLSLDSIPAKEMVYNFTLDGSHEYIANEYVVHNKADCGCNYAENECSYSPRVWDTSVTGCAMGKELCQPCN